MTPTLHYVKEVRHKKYLLCDGFTCVLEQEQRNYSVRNQVSVCLVYDKGVGSNFPGDGNVL